MASKHIVVYDQEGEIRTVISSLLRDLGYRVSVAGDVETLRVLARASGIDLIVLDASTSDKEGVDVALDAKRYGVRLVMISGNPEMMESFHNRADQLLWKPFGRDKLRNAVEAALV